MRPNASVRKPSSPPRATDVKNHDKTAFPCIPPSKEPEKYTRPSLSQLQTAPQPPNKRTGEPVKRAWACKTRVPAAHLFTWHHYGLHVIPTRRRRSRGLATYGGLKSRVFRPEMLVHGTTPLPCMLQGGREGRMRV